MDNVTNLFVNLLILPVGIIVFSLLSSSVLCFVTYKAYKKKWASILPFCLIPLCIIILISLMFDSLPYIEMLPKDKGIEQLSDIVQVVNVRSGMACPMYYDATNGKLSSTQIIKTNRGSFLGINCKGVEQGNYLHLHFLPYSRIIVDIEKTSEAEATAYWKTNPVPGPTSSEAQTKTAGGKDALLVEVMFVFFLAQGIAGDVFKWGILDRLRQRDNVVHRVIPRPYGKVHVIINILFFLIMVCLAIAWNIYYMATFVVIALGGTVFYFLRILNVRLTYDESIVCLKRLNGNTINIPFESVRNIYWKDQNRTMGCTLIIETDRLPTLFLPEINYIGLNELYKLWKRKTEEADDTGDGLREP